MSKTIAIYLRLSNEDNNVKKESTSISNQRLYINEYIKSRNDLKNCIIKEYLDDGFTGTNFERPAIKELLDDVKNRKINIIIVKDISRFGRNYIQVGTYLEEVFPFMRTRFIAINDDYDSIDPNCIGSIESAFKTIFADLYSKDLSLKIKSSFKNKAKKGQFINSFTPYGYLKSEDDKNKLVVDEEVAPIVKWIFEELSNGKSRTQIARELNAKRIPTPKQHKENCGSNLKINSCQKVNNWTNDTILAIISDQRYIGSVVYGKKSTPSVGSSKRIIIPKDNWIVVPNMHEKMVSEELFLKVQTNVKSIKVNYTKNTLASLLKCDICNHKLVKQGNPSYFKCKTGTFTDEFSCKDTKIFESDIRESVLQSIRVQAEFAINAEKLLKLNTSQNELILIKSEYSNIKKESDRWKFRFRELFQDKQDEKITAEHYTKEKLICDQKREELDRTSKKLEQQIILLENKSKINNNCIKHHKLYSEISELSDEVLELLIQEILVCDSNTIEIKWKFQNELRLLKTIKKT